MRLTHGCAAIASMMACAALARAQDAPELKVSPSLFAGDSSKSIGLKWEASAEKPGAWRYLKGRSFRNRWTGSVETEGAAALDADANATPISAAAKTGLFLLLSSPQTPGENPDSPGTGGFDLGSLKLSARADVEGNQRMTELNANFGAQLTYVISRLGLARIIPAIDLQYSAERALRSAVRDSLTLEKETHSRGQVHFAWHIPLFSTPLTLHANVRGWRSMGLPAQLEQIDADDGVFVALDLACATRWKVSRIGISEVFVRWVQGEVPEDWKQRRALMLGIQTGK